MGQSSYVARWTELICTWMRGRRARGIETVVIREVAFGHRECGYGSVYELLLVGTA